jgi:hypothetical protein
MQRNIPMSKLLRLAAAAVAVMAVPACAPLPPEYSSHYVQVPVESQKHPGKVTYVLVPEACLNPDPSDTGLGGPRLPPGCANNANLLAMAERKKDLVAGRHLGPAQGGPPAKAADAYLNASPGSGAPFPGGIQTPAPASKTDETVPTPNSPAIPK